LFESVGDRSIFVCQPVPVLSFISSPIPTHGISMSRRKYINGHRRRSCICGDDSCTYMSRWYCLADDPKLCAFIRLPPYSARQTGRGKIVRQIRTRMFTKVLGEQTDPKDDSIKDEWISAIHFHRSLLKDKNKGILESIDSASFKHLPKEVKSEYGRYDKYNAGPFEGQYFAIPTLSRNDVKDRFNGDRADAMVNPGDGLGQEADGRIDPDDRRKKIISRAMRADPDSFAIEYLRMENEILEMKLLLKSREKEHSMEVASLNAALDSMKELMKEHIRITDSGLNRATLSSGEWHKAHSSGSHSSSRFLFGIEDDFDQLRILLTEGFFVDVDPIGGTGDDPVTDFEKILLCLMRMRRRYEYQTLAYIVGRSEGQISRYMDEWLPKLGRVVGRFCCRLDMDKQHDYISAEHAEELGVPHSSTEQAPTNRFFFDDATPREFRDEEGMDMIAAMKDGKDFMTDTTRTNTALTRQMWSDKIKNSGGRCITWTTTSGLVFEYSGLYLARTPEIRLVEFFGQQC